MEAKGERVIVGVGNVGVITNDLNAPNSPPNYNRGLREVRREMQKVGNSNFLKEVNPRGEDIHPRGEVIRILVGISISVGKVLGEIGLVWEARVLEGEDRHTTWIRRKKHGRPVSNYLCRARLLPFPGTQAPGIKVGPVRRQHNR